MGTLQGCNLQEWEKYGQERPVGDKVSTFVDQLFDTIENFPGGWRRAVAD